MYCSKTRAPVPTEAPAVERAIGSKINNDSGEGGDVEPGEARFPQNLTLCKRTKKFTSGRDNCVLMAVLRVTVVSTANGSAILTVRLNQGAEVNGGGCGLILSILPPLLFLA